MGTQRQWKFATAHLLGNVLVLSFLVPLWWPTAVAFVAIQVGFFMGTTFGKPYLRLWGVIPDESGDSQDD